MSDELVKRLRDFGDHVFFEPHMHHTAADRIEELEAKLGDLGAIKEKAHRQGYEQGKAAGDAFGAAIRDHVERLEAERDALQAKLDEAVARAEVAEVKIVSVSDDALDKAIDASRALIAKMRDRTDDQWRRG